MSDDRHSVRWYVYVGHGSLEDREHPEAPDGFMPRTKGMSHQMGYDAICSCGWKSATGGAIKARVQEEIEGHKFNVRFEKELDKDAEIIAFAIANITGDGFSGDMGYKTVSDLYPEAQEWGYEHDITRFRIVLRRMVEKGDVLYRHGAYAGKPVQCVLCGTKPCSCAVTRR